MIQHGFAGTAAEQAPSRVEVAAPITTSKQGPNGRVRAIIFGRPDRSPRSCLPTRQLQQRLSFHGPVRLGLMIAANSGGSADSLSLRPPDHRGSTQSVCRNSNSMFRSRRSIAICRNPWEIPVQFWETARPRFSKSRKSIGRKRAISHGRRRTRTLCHSQPLDGRAGNPFVGMLIRGFSGPFPRTPAGEHSIRDHFMVVERLAQAMQTKALPAGVAAPLVFQREKLQRRIRHARHPW